MNKRRGTSLMSTATAPTSTASTALDAVRQGASNFNQSDLASWWDKVKSGAGAVGKFIADNPSLVKIGGEMLTSMYGPQAEQFDLQKSLIERAQRNLNTPIPLTYKRP